MLSAPLGEVGIPRSDQLIRLPAPKLLPPYAVPGEARDGLVFSKFAELVPMPVVLSPEPERCMLKGRGKDMPDPALAPVGADGDADESVTGEGANVPELLLRVA